MKAKVQKIIIFGHNWQKHVISIIFKSTFYITGFENSVTRIADKNEVLRKSIHIYLLKLLKSN